MAGSLLSSVRNGPPLGPGLTCQAPPAANVEGYRGLGLRADFVSTPPAAASLLRPPPPPRPPRPLSGTVGRAVNASTLEQLVAAIAAADVAKIMLTAHIQLNGTQLHIPPGRSVSVSGFCQLPSSSPSRSVPAGVCIIDANFASRHFQADSGSVLQARTLWAGARSNPALPVGCV